MRVLVFNCGSSSLKFELIEVEAAGGRGRSLARGVVENIGSQAAYTYWREDEAAVHGQVAQPSHEAAARHALQWLQSAPDLTAGLGAAVHRIVHGGATITQPVVVDDTVLNAIEQASIFAPLHNPPALA